MTRDARLPLTRRVGLAVRGIPVREAGRTGWATGVRSGRGGSRPRPADPPPPLWGVARHLRVIAIGAYRCLRWVALTLRHGRWAPRADERVWIVPRECRRRVSASQVGDIGVVGGAWTARSHRQPHEASAKMMDLIAHFRDGLPWTRTIQYRHRFGPAEARGEAFPTALAAERRAFLEDCARYDRIFEDVRTEGRLRTARELAELGEVPRSFADRSAPWREPGGVRVSIDAAGLPVWSGDGSHRLAMAIALDLPEMPARLMAVHPAALPDWRRRFRAGQRTGRGSSERAGGPERVGATSVPDDRGTRSSGA